MILLAIACAVAAGYQAVAALATIVHLLKKDPEPASLPPVSILKPVGDADEGFADALLSHARLDYPEYEIVFGVSSLADPAVQTVHHIAAAFPNRRIRVVECAGTAPNDKVGRLEQLTVEARHSTLVVSDADIRVPPEYLRSLAGALELPTVGLVTCLYRASGNSFPATWEALGIATDFAPGTLVAPFVGVREFGLGSTLAFRAADLEQAGGFAAIRDYLADDYQVGKRISGLGRTVHMSRMPVATWLGDSTWSEVWRHQVRWARTIRMSRGLYYGLPVTNASLWAALALIAGWGWTASGLITLRICVGLICGIGILRDPVTARWWWLMPLRDLWAFAVWVTGATGDTVEWRGRTITLDREGRIISVQGAARGLP